MPIVTLHLETPFKPSFRTARVAAMFDVPAQERLCTDIEVEVPDLATEQFQVAAIIGNSGSGKSSLAKHLFGDALYSPEGWPDSAIVDGFPKGVSMDAITKTLTAVGFSSPPSWLKPYAVLSNGERSRADLARALLLPGDIVVFDEFSSLVHRSVGQIMSAAISKQIRAGNIKKKFVAVSCHSDIVPWLAPDWVIDMSTRSLSRGLVRRPPIPIEIVRCKYDAWHLFKNHHYLDSGLHKGSRCYMATVDGEPAGFCALLHTFGFEGQFRITRVVVMPDYQGVGIGTKLMEWCAEAKLAEGAASVRIQGSHPSVVNHCKRSPRWRHLGTKVEGNPRSTSGRTTSTGRPICNFEFIPQGARNHGIN